jgi:hypothetical protein
MKTLAATTTLLLAFFFISCSDSSSPTKPEPTIIGKWKWLQSSAGVAHITYDPTSEGYNATLLIQSATHCAIYKNDTILQSGNCTFTTTDSITYHFSLSTGFTDSVITKALPHVVLPAVSNSHMIDLQMSGDSLTLWEDVSDGPGSLFIRQK